MKKIITKIIMIAAYIIFIVSFTICAIDFIFPNIKMPFVDASISLAFFSSIVIIVGTLVFLNKIP